VPAVRQKFHLAPCAKIRDHLYALTASTWSATWFERPLSDPHHLLVVDRCVYGLKISGIEVILSAARTLANCRRLR